MRELSLIAAIVAILAATIVLAQDEPQQASPPAASGDSTGRAASAPAGAPAARANPFSPLESGAAPAPGSASPPTPLETSPAPAAAVSQTATPATVKLNGILYCESKPLVVINDLIAGVGDEVAGMRVTAIARDKVTLAGPRGAWVMTPLQPEARPAPARAPEPGAGAPGHVPRRGTSQGGGHPRDLPVAARSDDPASLPAVAGGAANPEAAGGTPVVAVETTDQPIGEENP